MTRDYAGIVTEKNKRDLAQILLQSIPYDGTSTWGKGANRGFEVFLEATDNMELYDIETQSEVYKRGVHICEALAGFNGPEEMYQASYARAKELITTGKFPTFYGGEHSISIGILQAFYEQYKDLTVVQLDAHTDLRPSYLGSRYNHACAVHEASKHSNLLQLGIRSMDAEELNYVDENKIWYAADMHGKTEWMQDSIGKMTDEVYITLDLDILDPSIMPSTGTPEPGGLLWYETLAYLKKIFSSRNVVGFDIVEHAPIPNLRAPDFLVAKLYYKMLSYKFELKSVS